MHRIMWRLQVGFWTAKASLSRTLFGIAALGLGYDTNSFEAFGLYVVRHGLLLKCLRSLLYTAPFWVFHTLHVQIVRCMEVAEIAVER